MQDYLGRIVLRGERDGGGGENREQSNAKNGLWSCHWSSRDVDMTIEVFDGPLQVNAARAFDEDNVAGTKIFDEPLAGGFGIAKKDGGHSAGACGGGQVLGVALHGNDEIEAGLGGGASAGDVQRGPVLAQLEHLAGHQDAAARGRTRGKRANHGAQRFGVGVVAVVQNRCAGDLDDLAALVASGE